MPIFLANTFSKGATSFSWVSTTAPVDRNGRESAYHAMKQQEGMEMVAERRRKLDEAAPLPRWLARKGGTSDYGATIGAEGFGFRRPESAEEARLANLELLRKAADPRKQSGSKPNASDEIYKKFLVSEYGNTIGQDERGANAPSRRMKRSPSAPSKVVEAGKEEPEEEDGRAAAAPGEGQKASRYHPPLPPPVLSEGAMPNTKRFIYRRVRNARVYLPAALPAELEVEVAEKGEAESERRKGWGPRSKVLGGSYRIRGSVYGHSYSMPAAKLDPSRGEPRVMCRTQNSFTF